MKDMNHVLVSGSGRFNCEAWHNVSTVSLNGLFELICEANGSSLVLKARHDVPWPVPTMLAQQ
jgi:hypothetical protein